MKFEKFFWGYYRGCKAWFYRENGGWGVSNALIVRLSAVGLLARCLLLLLVYYLHLLYSVIWCLYMQGLRLLYYIVSIYTYNVYYVIKGFNLFLWYLYYRFYFNRLNGHSEWLSLKALCSKGLRRRSFDFFSIFLLHFFIACMPCCCCFLGLLCVYNAYCCCFCGFWHACIVLFIRTYGFMRFYPCFFGAFLS